MCDMGISKRMYGFDMSLSFIVSYRLGREYYNNYDMLSSLVELTVDDRYQQLDL